MLFVIPLATLRFHHVHQLGLGSRRPLSPECILRTTASNFFLFFHVFAAGVPKTLICMVAKRVVVDQPVCVPCCCVDRVPLGVLDNSNVG